jgi:hypothetical protein
VEKFLAFYGTAKFIAVLTKAHTGSDPVPDDASPHAHNHISLKSI